MRGEVEVTVVPPLLEGEVDERGDRAIIVGKLVGDVKAVHAWMPDCCEFVR